MTEPSTLPRLVEAAAVARRMGETFDERDTARVEDYLESVTAVVLDEGLASWADVTTCPARVRVIVLDAVERKLNNPEQLQQRIVGGDMEMSSAAGKWLTPEELAAVRRLAGKVGADGLTSSRTPLAVERAAMLGRALPDDYYGGYRRGAAWCDDDYADGYVL